MKNLFQAQVGADEQNAKKSFVEVLTHHITEHVKLQRKLTEIIASGDKKCHKCAIHKITRKMSRIQLQVTEICRMYELIFDDQVNVDELSRVATKEFFPVLWQGAESNKEVFDIAVPHKGDISEGEDIFLEKIKSSLKASLPPGTEFHVMKQTGKEGIIKTGGLFGVKPEDYSSFSEFHSAVMDKIAEKRNEGKSGEQIITEAILGKVNTEEELMMKSSEEDFNSKSPITNKAIEKARNKRNGNKGNKKSNNRDNTPTPVGEA